METLNLEGIIIPEMKELLFLCVKTQKELKDYLENILHNYYNEVYSSDGYLFAKGEIPVCLVAHMDVTPYVSKRKEETKDTSLYYRSDERKTITIIYQDIDDMGNHIYSAKEGIGGDDRCGIYALLKIIEKGYKPYILFTEDEEIGCIGAQKFCKSSFINELKEMKFLVQIDRRGNNDAVFYNDVNTDFHKFVCSTTKYVEQQGSYTDIVELSNACRISSVNLSSGYYNEHTEYEAVCIEELLNTVKAVEKLIVASTNVNKFEFKESNFASFNYGWFDEDEEVVYCFQYIKNGNIKKGYGVGITEKECIGDFLMGNEEINWNDVIEYYEIFDGKDEDECGNLKVAY